MARNRDTGHGRPGRWHLWRQCVVSCYGFRAKCARTRLRVVGLPFLKFLNFEIESCDILYCYCVYFYWALLLYGTSIVASRQLTHDQIEKYGQNSQEPSPMQLQIVGELTFVTRAVDYMGLQ